MNDNHHDDCGHHPHDSNNGKLVVWGPGGLDSDWIPENESGIGILGDYL